MNRPSRERVASRFLGSRPGPHWDPYPASKAGRTLAGLLASFEDYIRNDGRMFYSLYDDASEKDFILLTQLRDALKKRDQAAAKRYVDALQNSRSSAAGIVNDNMLMTYVIDGREAI